MIDSSVFQNSNWLWPVVFIALFLWIIFVWKEWNKPVKNQFYFNCVISLITLLALAFLALRPLSSSLSNTNPGVLLTNGFNQKHLDSLKKEFKDIRVINYKRNLPIGKVLDSLGSLFILGDGIETYDFWQFKNRSTTYLSADVPDGIIDLKYGRESVLGEDLRIKGSYNNARASNRIVLQDFNGQGLDSVVLNSEKIQRFKLSTSLKTKGKFVFELVEKDSLGKVVSSEPLPFKVLARANLSILLVNGFPTFETKYLKNYLAEMGHEVVVRSRLTRGRYKFEYFNTQRIPVYRLGEKELEKFDLLVIDGKSFRNLSKSVWSSIEKTIRNTGLGLFVQSESSLFNSSSERLRLKFDRDGLSKVILNEFPKLTLEKFPYKFENTNGLEGIHRSNKNLVTTAYKRMEKGRIGATLIQNTYRLQLEGRTKTYRRFWSDVVTKLSKKEQPTADWELTNSFPLENHAVKVKLRTTIKEPHVFTANGNQVALKQDIDIPSLWTGTTYPIRKGWNLFRLETESQEALDFYVADSLNWKPLRATILQKENRRYFADSPQELKMTKSTILFNPLWFFLIGLLGLGYLWLHPKLFKN